MVAESAGFLYKQVRAVTGCLVEVARGSLPIDAIDEMFESRVRSSRVLTAPPHGLFFVAANYSQAHELTHSIEHEVDWVGPLHEDVGEAEDASDEN